MNETQLLIFRWGAKEYGVSAEDVIGVAGNTWMNRLAVLGCVEEIINQQGKSIRILDVPAGIKTEDKKLALLMHSNGVQIVIMVDEVIKITGLADVNELVLGTTIATIRIWQFK